MFIDNDSPVAVTLDGENIIYVRQKMDLGVKAELQSRLVRMQMPILTKSQSGKGSDHGNATPSMVNLDFGASQIATLELNILKWEGAAFRDKKGRPIPISLQTIRKLDPDEPLVKAVLKRIDELNKPPALPAEPGESEASQEDDSKNDSTPDGADF